MAQTVLITLTTAGADTGPFNLYSNIDGYVAPFATGISKSALTAGYLSTAVPDSATTIRVKSQSVLCTNYVDLYFGEATTTTTSSTSSSTTSTSSSTTTSTTTLGYVSFNLAYSATSGAEACSDYPTLNTTLYYAAPGSALTTSTIIYLDQERENPAPNGFYSNGTNYWNTGGIPASGNLQNQTSCTGSTTTSTTTS